MLGTAFSAEDTALIKNDKVVCMVLRFYKNVIEMKDVMGLINFQKVFQLIFSAIQTIPILVTLPVPMLWGASLNSTIKGNQPDSAMNTGLVGRVLLNGIF